MSTRNRVAIGGFFACVAVLTGSFLPAVSSTADEPPVEACTLDSTTGVITCGSDLPMPVETAAPYNAALDSGTMSCYLIASTGESGCFSTEAQMRSAYEADTGRTLAPLGETAPGVLGSGIGLAPMADYVAAILYDGPSWTGSSLIITITSSTYCAGVKYTGNLTTWGDRIESFRSYGNCKTTLYENQNQNGGQQGSAYGPYVSASTLGAMANRASSYKLSS